MSYWAGWTHYVYARGEWHRCPHDCGGMCDWRPRDNVVPIRRVKG